jgi:hypothetical protein
METKLDSWGFPESSPKEEKVSDFYKLDVGDTKLRVLTQPVPVYKLTKGVFPNTTDLGYVTKGYEPKEDEKVNIKGWVWASVAGAGVKIVTLPYSVVGLIQKLRAQDDYAFDEFPMPYEITIHNTGVGANRYTVTAARKNTPVSDTELAELAKKTPITDILKKIKEKASKGAVEPIAYPEGDVDQIPF